MNSLTIIQVSVRRSGDCYLARAGKGKTSKTASSTSSAHFAAQAAAEKYVGKKNILSIGPINGTSQSAELFRVEAWSKVRPARLLKPAAPVAKKGGRS